jgi:hypothetical protein
VPFQAGAVAPRRYGNSRVGLRISQVDPWPVV